MDSADIAIPIISMRFFGSSFIAEREIPYLLRLRRRGLTIFPVLWSTCDWKSVDWLRPMQVFKPSSGSLDLLTYGERQVELTRCSRQVTKILEDRNASSTGESRLALSVSVSQRLFYPSRSRAEMVSAYQDASLSGFARSDAPFLSFDLTLYQRKFDLWFQPEYLNVWNTFVSRETPVFANEFHKRKFIQLLPYRVPDYIDLRDAQSEWAIVKTVLHSMLCSGRCGLIRIGSLPDELNNLGEYGVVRRGMFAETPGIHAGVFDTRCVLGHAVEVEDRFDLINSSVGEVVTSSGERPDGVYPVYYTYRTFAPSSLDTEYFEDMRRFVWALQGECCAQCEPMERISLQDSRLIQYFPSESGGNQSLLNLEVVCKSHEVDVVKGPDYRRVLIEGIGLPVPLVRQVIRHFSPTLRRTDFPFRISYDPFPSETL